MRSIVFSDLSSDVLIIHRNYALCQPFRLSLPLFSARIAAVIWVLTAGFGDGHNTAARCIAEALRETGPDEETLVADLVGEVHPLLASVLKSGYQVAIIRFPSIWRAIYDRLAKPNAGASSMKYLEPLLAAMAARLRTHRPRAIVSTYPLYAGLVQALKAKGIFVPPLVTVITDSVSVHPVWMMAPSDLYLVADKETREVVVRQYGIPEAKVQVTGFPVSLDFRHPPPIPTDDGATHRVLYFPSTPASHVAQTLAALRPQLIDGVKLTMPVGKHGSRLYHTTRRFADANPNARFELVGWTNRIPELLQTHDVLITKAGGAILHEVLAARIPPVIDYVVPGQEEGNAAMLLDNQCGLRSHSPQETADCVRRLLENQGVLGTTMRENMRPLSMPDAASRAAQAVLAAATKQAPIL
ncbi:MAG: Processive 1,2-diacylglycerol beta-glucosyltransferase [Verrucomicrobiaceae bacterium]|nr:Processive 1,2-diacylglycerol beta-glucosyltransferase [Verrucomicrobiaceae bacterium]